MRAAGKCIAARPGVNQASTDMRPMQGACDGDGSTGTEPGFARSGTCVMTATSATVAQNRSGFEEKRSGFEERGTGMWCRERESNSHAREGAGFWLRPLSLTCLTASQPTPHPADTAFAVVDVGGQRLVAPAAALNLPGGKLPSTEIRLHQRGQTQSPWCRERDSNPHDVTTGGFCLRHALLNLPIGKLACAEIPRVSRISGSWCRERESNSHAREGAGF